MVNESSLASVEDALGYRFNDRGLLTVALTHRTFVEELHPGGAAPAHLSQQRLEFLGDAVLNYVLARWLFDLLPHVPEGELTARRSDFARADWLETKAESFGLHAHVLFGKGEAACSGRNRVVGADTLEALIGAIALDGGEERARQLVLRWLPAEPPTARPGDPIIRFHEWYQGRFRGPPPKPPCTPTGPDHAKEWTATLRVDGITAIGTGRNTKEARRAACQSALDQLGVD